VARAQDAEVGDGTTSTTLLAAEFLKQCKDFIEEGMNPHIIIKGYRKAAELVSFIFASPFSRLTLELF
jgi:T-complex protein 1 subunit eta